MIHVCGCLLMEFTGCFDLGYGCVLFGIDCGDDFGVALETSAFGVCGLRVPIFGFWVFVDSGGWLMWLPRV